MKSTKKTSFTSKQWHKHPFALPVITFMGLFFIALIGFIAFNGQTIGANDAKVVHLYIDGEDRVIPTRATTVQEVFDQANISLRQGDKAEPVQDSPITDANFDINVYRARPITVIDEDGQRTTARVIESTPKAMARKAGVKVFPEDNVSIAPPDDAFKDGVIGDKVAIDRAVPATVNLYGNSVSVRSHAQTVGELLAEKGIKPIEGDTVTPSRDTPLTKDTQIFVASFGKQIATSEEIIEPPIERAKDPNQPAGSSTVTEPGSPGKKLVTYEVELKNGKEVSRKAIQEVVSVQPVTRVITEGTKVIISNPSANVELGRSIAAQMGYSDQFYCIYNIFERESRWNHLAGNASGAYGIPQALPGSKMGPGWQTNPEVQIRWGINYMAKRYGSPCAAWQLWQVQRHY